MEVVDKVLTRWLPPLPLSLLTQLSASRRCVRTACESRESRKHLFRRAVDLACANPESEVCKALPFCPPPRLRRFERFPRSGVGETALRPLSVSKVACIRPPVRLTRMVSPRSISPRSTSPLPLHPLTAPRRAAGGVLCLLRLRERVEQPHNASLDYQKDANPPLCGLWLVA